MVTAFTIWRESQAKPSEEWQAIYVGTVIVDVVGILFTYDTIKLFMGV